MFCSKNIRSYMSNKKRDLLRVNKSLIICKIDNYSSTAACAAARRAIGTRNGEQLA